MSYNSEVIADSPIAYWRLGEASGNPQDSAGTNHVNAVTGTPTYGVAGALSGDSNKAIEFDGSTEYLSVPHATALNLGDVFSIEFWFKRDVVTVGHWVIDKGYTGGDAYTVYFATNDFLRLARSSDGLTIVQTNAAITDTASWHHVVFTKNGVTSEVYLDGGVVTLLGTNVTLANSSNTLKIGVHNDIYAHFDGSLDEIALYNTALSAGRVAAHYATRLGSGLVRGTYPQFPKFPLRRTA